MMQNNASSHNSYFAAQMRPRQPEVLQTSGHTLATWEKWVEIARVVSYLLGALLFLIGSIYFYPKYTVMWNGTAGTFASWNFLLGCIMYFIGANLDFIQTIRYNHVTQLRQVLRAFNALCNYMASSIFVLGALYFLPTWYPKAPELGCWSFIIGCILFCIAAMVEMICFVCMTTHDDPQEKPTFRLTNIISWSGVTAVATFIGSLLFILGSWYYLPQYINDSDNGMYYMNKAITCYVIGSVFYLLSAIGMIPDVYDAIQVKKTQPYHHDLDSSIKV